MLQTKQVGDAHAHLIGADDRQAHVEIHACYVGRERLSERVEVSSGWCTWLAEAFLPLELATALSFPPSLSPHTSRSNSFTHTGLFATLP